MKVSPSDAIDDMLKEFGDSMFHTFLGKCRVWKENKKVKAREAHHQKVKEGL